MLISQSNSQTLNWQSGVVTNLLDIWLNTKGGGISLNGLSRLLVETGFGKKGQGRPHLKSWWEEGSEEPNQNLVKENHLNLSDSNCAGIGKSCTGPSCRGNHNHSEDPTDFMVKVKMKLQGFESPQCLCKIASRWRSYPYKAEDKLVGKWPQHMNLSLPRIKAKTMMVLPENQEPSDKEFLDQKLKTLV